MNKSQDGVIEIDLLQMFSALGRNILIIIIVALILGGAAFAGTYMFIEPKYQATATFYVNNSSFTFGSTSFSISSGELSAAQTLVNTYIEILKSRTTLEEIIAEASIPYSVGQLDKMLSTQSVSNTGIFKVTAESGSPTEAELIANTVAKVLPDRITEIVDGSAVRIVDYAIVPAQRSSPSYIKNCAIGALIGAFIVCAVVVIREIIYSQEDAIICSADDLGNLFSDIPVLGTIPDMRDASKKGYYYSNYYVDSMTGKNKEAK